MWQRSKTKKAGLCSGRAIPTRHGTVPLFSTDEISGPDDSGNSARALPGRRPVRFLKPSRYQPHCLKHASNVSVLLPGLLPGSDPCSLSALRSPLAELLPRSSRASSTQLGPPCTSGANAQTNRSNRDQAAELAQNASETPAAEALTHPRPKGGSDVGLKSGEATGDLRAGRERGGGIPGGASDATEEGKVNETHRDGSRLSRKLWHASRKFDGLGFQRSSSGLTRPSIAGERGPDASPDCKNSSPFYQSQRPPTMASTLGLSQNCGSDPVFACATESRSTQDIYCLNDGLDSRLEENAFSTFSHM